MLGNAFSVSARPVSIWSANELWEKADLVVMGTANTSQDEYKVENAKADTWIPVLTKFNIEAVLKGQTGKKSVADNVFLTVRHNRYFDRVSEIAVIDGPSFVEFDPEPKNQYLIFLVRKPDGVYEPLTGQYAPWQSFLMVEAYHQSKERKK
jgi:hypothetical protein